MAFDCSEVKAKVPNMVLSTQHDLTPIFSSSSYGISLPSDCANLLSLYIIHRRTFEHVNFL